MYSSACLFRKYAFFNILQNNKITTSSITFLVNAVQKNEADATRCCHSLIFTFNM